MSSLYSRTTSLACFTDAALGSTAFMGQYQGLPSLSRVDIVICPHFGNFFNPASLRSRWRLSCHSFRSVSRSGPLDFLKYESKNSSSSRLYFLLVIQPGDVGKGFTSINSPLLK